MDGSPSTTANQGEAVDVHAPFTTAERMQQLNEIDLDVITLLKHASAAMRSIAQTPAELASAAAADKPNDTTSVIPPPPPTSSVSFGPGAPASPAAQQFGAIQQAFLATLDRVDKRLKRQIWALEEAGIVTLGRSAPGAIGAADLPPSQSQSQSQQATAAGSFSSQRPTVGGASAQSGGGGTGSAGQVPPPVPPPLEPDGMGRYGGLDVGMLNAAGGDTVSRDMERELWAKARAHTVALAGDRMQE